MKRFTQPTYDVESRQLHFCTLPNIKKHWLGTRTGWGHGGNVQGYFLRKDSIYNKATANPSFSEFIFYLLPILCWWCVVYKFIKCRLEIRWVLHRMIKTYIKILAFAWYFQLYINKWKIIHSRWLQVSYWAFNWTFTQVRRAVSNLNSGGTIDIHVY